MRRGTPVAPHCRWRTEARALTAAWQAVTGGCDRHWEATLPGAARGPEAEAKAPGPRAPLPGRAPGRRTLPACPGPEEGPGRALGVWLGSSRGRGGRLGPPTPRLSSKPRQALTRLPAQRAQQAEAPSRRLAGGKPTAHWAGHGRTRQLEPSDVLASHAPPGLSLPTAKGLSGLAARPATITPASEKSRASCGGSRHKAGATVHARPRLYPQWPQDVSVP